MIIQYIKIPFSRAVFISNYKTDKNVTQNMIKGGWGEKKKNHSED